MKTKALIVIVLSLFCGKGVGETIEFEVPFPESNTTPVYMPAKPDSVRLSRKKFAKFKAVASTGFEAEKEVAFNEAVKLWEEVLSFKRPVQIESKFGKVSSGMAYIVSLKYGIFSDGIKYPRALYEQLIEDTDSVQTGVSMTITFNDNMDLWDFDLRGDEPLPAGKYDFVTEAVRAIGMGLGFGAGLNGGEGRVGFKAAINGKTVYLFDQYVTDASGVELSSFMANTTALNDFVKRPVYFDGEEDFQLYTPDPFVKNRSLCFFQPDATDVEKQPMYPDSYGRVRNIGSKIVDVLDRLGWERKKALEMEITSAEIPESGIIEHDRNKNYWFNCTTSSPVSNYRWSFDIVQKDGSYRTVSVGNEPLFYIALPESFSDTDDRTLDGLVKCRIHCTVSYNGKDYDADYALFVRANPDRPRIEILDVEIIDDYSCNLTVGFHAWGAESYSLYVYDPYLDSTVASEVEAEGYTRLIIDNLYADTDYEITIQAYTGKRGSESEVLIFNMNDYLPQYKTAGIGEIEETVSGVIVNLQGLVVGRFTGDYRETVDRLQPGIYIVKGATSKGQMVNRKIMVR